MLVQMTLYLPSYPLQYWLLYYLLAPVITGFTTSQIADLGISGGQIKTITSNEAIYPEFSNTVQLHDTACLFIV